MNTYSRIRAWAANRRFRPIPSSRTPRASAALWLAILLCGGCTSYHETSLHQIETRPDKFIDKKVRVHYAGTVDSTIVNGRTARERSGTVVWGPSDSVVSLRVDAINYPVLSGSTFYDPRLYGTTEPGFPLQVDLTGSRKVEVLRFNAVETVLLLGGIALVAAAVYAGMEAASDEFVSGFFGSLFGGNGSHSSVAPSPQHQ